MNDSVTITLRNVETSDISIFFEQQLDPEANQMAAFVREDPHDRAAFDARWKRIMDSTGIVNKTILRGEEVAGHISFYLRKENLTSLIGLERNTGQGNRNSSPQKTASRNYPSATFRKRCKRQHWIDQGVTEMRFQDYR